MFPITLTKEQFLGVLSDMSESEIDVKISHYKEILSLMEQMKSQKVTTPDLWYLSAQLIADEKVINKIQTYGSDLKVPKDIEVTNTGRVFYKGTLLELQKDSHGNFGVWYPHVGWKTKSNGISYRARYEFSSPEENQQIETLYSIDKEFFDEIDTQWQARHKKLTENNHAKGVEAFDKYSGEGMPRNGVGETSSGIPYSEEGVYLGDGVYISPDSCPF